MSLFYPSSFTVTNRTTGAYTNGVWAEGSETSRTITGSVQPFTARDYISTPGGRDDVGMVKIYTTETMQVSKAGGDTSGDLLEWQGKVWKVTGKYNYSNNIISHNKYIAEYIGDVE